MAYRMASQVACMAVHWLYFSPRRKYTYAAALLTRLPPTKHASARGAGCNRCIAVQVRVVCMQIAESCYHVVHDSMTSRRRIGPPVRQNSICPGRCMAQSCYPPGTALPGLRTASNDDACHHAHDGGMQRQVAVYQGQLSILLPAFMVCPFLLWGRSVQFSDSVYFWWVHGGHAMMLACCAAYSDGRGARCRTNPTPDACAHRACTCCQATAAQHAVAAFAA